MFISSKRPPLLVTLHAFLSGFAGLATVALIEQYGVANADLPLVIGAFGATAVLLYGAAESPLAKPYNVLVGHLVSALAGVAVYKLAGEANWWSIGLAVALAIAAMQQTRSLHPPGGASALIAVIGSEQIHDLGFLYVLYPVELGVTILLAMAFLTRPLLPARYRSPALSGQGMTRHPDT